MKNGKCKLQIKESAWKWITRQGLFHFSVFIFQFSFFNFFPSSATAAFDADADKPYKVQIVLRFAEHKQLTAAFKDKAERELLNSLQAALGEMGEVEIIHKHPKLKEIDDNGLEAALNNWREVTEVKTQFVLIAFKDGEFEIHARQHDGYTGLSSHYRKPETVSDRLLISRTAALLIDRDFGAGGAVEGIDAQSARIHFRAAALEGSLDRWVKKGEIFAVARIDVPAGKELEDASKWTLLQAREEPSDGKCLCDLLQGNPRPLPAGEYRCVKMGTTQGPLRIQLVKKGSKPEKPVANQQILVRKKSFKPDEKPEEGTTDSAGLFSTEQRNVSYDYVAFVSCMVNKSIYRQFPVPIYDDRPTKCPVAISQDAKTQLSLDRMFWEQNMYETDLMQVKLFAELLKSDTETRKQTLEKAKNGLERLDTDLAQFEAKRQELLKRQMDAAAGAARLKGLREKREKLKTFVANQEEVIRAENDPNRKDILELINQAQLLEEKAEFGKALEVYDKVLAKVAAAGIKDPKLTDYAKHVEQLRKNWAVQGDAHEAARTFIYETWPSLKPDDLQRGVGKAREALDVCRRAGDTLAPQKLAKVALDHQGELNKKRSELNPEFSTDDVKAAQAIEAVLDDLAKLLDEVTEVLKQKAPAK
jgi:hypothetical protein